MNIRQYFRDSLSERLFSFVLVKYIVCDICGLRSPTFETNTVLSITPTNNASMPELLLQDHKQKLYKTCSRCKKDTWHVESKHILQPPNYLIINVNGFNYMNNIITKNRCTISKHHPRSLQIYPASYCRPPWKVYSLWSLYCFCQLLLKKHPIAMMIELQNAILLIQVIHKLYIYYCINW